MTNQTTNATLVSGVSPLQFRLDILRLTFTVEGRVESLIREAFGNRKKISLDEFVNSFTSEEKALSYIKGCKENLRLAYKQTFSQNKIGERYVIMTNLINHASLGSLIKLFSGLRHTLVMEPIERDYENIEKKVLRKWFVNIRNTRNILAHRTTIYPETFFEKSETPTVSKRLKMTNKNDLKKGIFRFLIPEKFRDEKIAAIFEKYL